MLAQRHAQRESIEETSEDLFHNHTHLFSHSPSTSAVSFVSSFSLLFVMPLLRCPVHGCGTWSSEWGKKSYPLPSLDIFTLQLASTVDLSVNNRICRPCWRRHKDHNMTLYGRIRVQPIASPSPLDALLSAAVSPLPPSPDTLHSPYSLTSLSSPPPTPAHVIMPSPASPIVASCSPQNQQPSTISPTTVQRQSCTSTSTIPNQSNTGPTVITSPRRTHSFPPVLDLSPAPATYSERQRDVVASVMAGIDYERYRLQQVMLGVTPMAKSTWYDHQSTVYNSIIQIAESKEVEYLQMLRATGQRLVFCADAAWSHRGYEANQCCWLLLNAENKQIALAVILTKARWEKGQEVHKGNYKGSSRGMEGEAMERGIARLKENGLLSLVQGWVCDKDSSVSEQLKANPDTAHIPIHYDPGHIKKNFQKSLMQIYGNGVRYKGLAERGG